MPHAATAIDLLRSLPREVSAINSRGGSTDITILDVDTTDRTARVVGAVTGLAKGDVLQIRKRTPDQDGYDLDFEIAEVFFESTHEVVAILVPVAVTVRAPRRQSDRLHAHALVVARDLATSEQFEGQLADISETGIAFHGPQPLDVGDRLHLTVPLGGGEIVAEAIVVGSDRAVFGRMRIRCEFTGMGEVSRARIAALAQTQTPGDSSLAA